MLQGLLQGGRCYHPKLKRVRGMSSPWYEETKGLCPESWLVKRLKPKNWKPGEQILTSFSSPRSISSHALHWLNPTSSYRATHQDTEHSGNIYIYIYIKRQSEGANTVSSSRSQCSLRSNNWVTV